MKPRPLKMATTCTTITDVEISQVGTILTDIKRPLAERFRALFTLRNIGGELAITLISQCLVASSTSPLLKHECAYCLGQMRDARSLPILKQVLQDKTENSMVRHEAGEALAAIGNTSIIPILEQYIDDPFQEVAETCQLAIEKLNWIQANISVQSDSNPYTSIDPAPPMKDGDLVKWSHDLINTELPLFHRYQAMFALRNHGGNEAITALVKGLSNDQSALFKHEIAYVLGQMQHPGGVDGLHTKLGDLSEHSMVRHECAEALGSIATDECLKILQTYLVDKEEVVRESCEVALDMYQHEHSNEFQYANGLTTLCNK